MHNSFELRNLRLKNYESDVPALIAQRAAAGIQGEPYHYSLVNFAIVFDFERIGTGRPRVFHRIRCEIELERLTKLFRYDIMIDLPEGAPSQEMEKPISGQPMGQVEPGDETATVRLIDGDQLLLSIRAPVSFSGPANFGPRVVLDQNGVWID